MKLTKLTSAILLGATLLTGIVACSKQDNSTAQTSQTTSHKSTAAKSSDNSQSSQTSDSSTETTNSVKTEISKIKLSQQEAIDKFHSQFSGKQIKSIDLSLEGKQYVYEIEGFDSTHEYSAEINAETGHASSVHSERLDHDDRNEALNLDGIISRDEASVIAEEHAKGTSQEWKLDQEHGKTYWEVEVANGHQSTEVKIDAHSKKILETEHDD
ncbi:PepSY domain-containing protein [Lactobacillus amylovorus]|uniref:PepSY domain-containing protein n=1 Tax=Lactobacillus amylovorus TaxID=1604 RepID=UPI002330B15F|nr:PepSY domain-containing protein [Lactobacillus amylovorus]MDB6234233.1 PepSY domain-containing protein [Lactobacillus amylovorus]